MFSVYQQDPGWLQHCGRRDRERILIMQHIHFDNIYNQTPCSQPGLEPTCIFKRQIIANFFLIRELLLFFLKCGP